MDQGTPIRVLSYKSEYRPAFRLGLTLYTWENFRETEAYLEWEAEERSQIPEDHDWPYTPGEAFDEFKAWLCD